LPAVMADTDRVASAAERGAIELAEAMLLRDRVGEKFDAAVLEVDAPQVEPPGAGKQPRKPGGTVAVDDPPVRARCEGELPLGERVAVRLVTADPAARKVLFERV
jgi:exoribonuclease R